MRVPDSVPDFPIRHVPPAAFRCHPQGGRDGVRRPVGVQLPPFAKSDLFRGVVLGGVLPKKTFSMGEATEKRYYMECRRL